MLLLEQIDFDTLVKGTYIPAEAIAAELGISTNAENYGFHLMNLKNQIELHIKKATGLTPTIKSEDKGLRILIDAEASVYNEKRMETARRQLLQAHRRNKDVDESLLTPEERRDHQRRLVVGSNYEQALKTARRKSLPPRAHVRQIPSK